MSMSLLAVGVRWPGGIDRVCRVVYNRGMSNAFEFVNEIADVFRANGREVEVKVTDESFGKAIWVYSPAPHWHQNSLSISAYHSHRTGRWKLGKLNVGGTPYSNPFTRTTRRDIRITADIYSR